MKLSIIIPVYRVETYLDFCLKSSVQQNVDDCEVILVNDGSPDRSGDICDEWCRKNRNFQVIHCAQNKGLSAARNKGIEKAHGEYITFIDSDDYLSPNTLKSNLELLEKAPDVDVLEYPVCVEHGAESSYHYVPGKGEVVSFPEWMTRKGYMHSYAWNKLYRRTLWEKKRFPEGKLFEDVYTIPFILQQAGHILRSNRGLYYYCNRKGSISHTVTPRGIEDLLQAHLQLYRNVSAHPDIPEKALDDLYLCLCNPQIVSLQMGGSLCIPDRKIPLHRALFTRRPANYHLKAILKSLSGKKYCKLMAQTRKMLRK